MIRAMGSFVMVAAMVGLATAQPPSPNEVGGPPAPPVLTDPTSPSPKLRDVLTTKTAAAGTVSKTAPLLLRGRVMLRGKLPAVLLEVDGKVYTVVQGGSLSVGGSSTLQVLSVTGTEVTVQYEPQKEKMTLR